MSLSVMTKGRQAPRQGGACHSKTGRENSEQGDKQVQDTSLEMSIVVSGSKKKSHTAKVLVGEVLTIDTR